MTLWTLVFLAVLDTALVMSLVSFLFLQMRLIMVNTQALTDAVTKLSAAIDNQAANQAAAEATAQAAVDAAAMQIVAETAKLTPAPVP